MIKKSLSYILACTAGVTIFVTIMPSEGWPVMALFWAMCISVGLFLGHLVVTETKSPNHAVFLTVCVAIGVVLGDYYAGMPIVTALGGFAVGKILSLLSNPGGSAEPA